MRSCAYNLEREEARLPTPPSFQTSRTEKLMTEHDKPAIHLAPGDGVSLKNPVGGPLTFKVRGDQANGAVTVVESTAPPGEGPPLHVHAKRGRGALHPGRNPPLPIGGRGSGGPDGRVRLHPEGDTAYVAERKAKLRHVCW